MNNTSKIVIWLGVLLAVVLSLCSLFFSPQQAAVVVGDILPPNPIAPAGLNLGQNIGVKINAKGGTIGRGVNQGFWRNETGGNVVVDYAEMQTTGIASSSMIFSAGTSTAATITDNFSAPFSTLIDQYLVATSAPAKVINSELSTTTNSQGSIIVGPGVYVNFLVRSRGVNCPTTGGACESATSTSRGFNVNWALFYHTLSTQ